MGWPPRVLRFCLLGAVSSAEFDAVRTREAEVTCGRGCCYDSFSLVQTHSVTPASIERSRPSNALAPARVAISELQRSQANNTERFQQRVNDTTRRVDEQRSPAVILQDPGEFHRRLLDGTIKAVSGPRLPMAIVYVVLVLLGLVATCGCGIRQVSKSSSGCGAVCTFAGTAFLVFFLGVLAAAFFSLWYLSGAVIEEAIEHFDMSFLGVDIEMDSLDINIFNGQVEIKNIVLNNPKGYAIKTLLKANRLHIDLGVRSLICSFGKHVLAEHIVMDHVKVIYERSWTSSNVADMLRFLGDDSDMGAFKVTIQKVDVTNIDGQASSSLFTGVNYPLNVPDIHYEDFTSEVGAMGISGVVKKLLSRILHNIIEATAAVPGLARTAGLN